MTYRTLITLALAGSLFIGGIGVGISASAENDWRSPTPEAVTMDGRP